MERPKNMSHVRVRRSIFTVRFSIAAAAALTLTTCRFVSPVTSELTLAFDQPDEVRITTVTTLETTGLEHNPALRSRLAGLRDALSSDRDEWSVRFAAVTPHDERVIRDKSDGLLRQVEHSALVPRTKLQRFFSDLPITINTTSEGGVSELTIYPGTSTRATAEQREAFTRSLDSWSQAIVRYVASVDALYSYLDAKPQRARAVMAFLLWDVIPVEQRPPYTPLVTDDEQAMTDRVGDAMAGVSAFFDLDEHDAFTLNETADLVYNPFPAGFTIRIPGRIVESEGFTHRTSQTLTIPRGELADAVSALEQRWVAPDPLALYLRVMREKNAPPVDLEIVLNTHRRAESVLSGSEIRKEVESRLTPKASYRVRWTE